MVLPSENCVLCEAMTLISFRISCSVILLFGNSDSSSVGNDLCIRLGQLMLMPLLFSVSLALWPAIGQIDLLLLFFRFCIFR